PPSPLSRPLPTPHTGRGGMHARPFRAGLPLLPVWGVGRGREKRAGVMRVLGGGSPPTSKIIPCAWAPPSRLSCSPPPPHPHGNDAARGGRSASPGSPRP